MDDISRVDIDLSAVDHNIARLRELVGPSTRICPVVKSDAYGLGATRIARRLAGNGIEMFAVFTPAEATSLIAAGIPGTFLILMPVRQVGRVDHLYRALVTDRVHLSAQDTAHVDALASLADQHAVGISVHLEVDTGMVRCGCSELEAPSLLRRIDAHPRLRLAGVYSHFSSAATDAVETHAQMDRFEHLLDDCAMWIPGDCMIHVANSSGTLRSPRFHRSCVRVGGLWAGYGPDQIVTGEPSLIPQTELRPVVRWTSSIMQVRRVPAGTRVGYNQRWTTTRPTTLGVVPVGYADGYPTALARRDDARDLPACVRVLANGLHPDDTPFAPVVGAVSMDMMSIDLTDVIEFTGERSVSEGTAVELIGTDHEAPNHMPRLARAAGLLPYQVLCGLSTSVPRTYIEPTRPTIVTTMSRRSLVAG